MMLECSIGELLARAAFMHHDDQGHYALLHYAPPLEGLKLNTAAVVLFLLFQWDSVVSDWFRPRVRSFHPGYYRGTCGIVLVYDVTDDI